MESEPLPKTPVTLESWCPELLNRMFYIEGPVIGAFNSMTINTVRILKDYRQSHVSHHLLVKVSLSYFFPYALTYDHYTPSFTLLNILVCTSSSLHLTDSLPLFLLHSPLLLPFPPPLPSSIHYTQPNEPREITDDEIFDRCFFAMVNGAFMILDEGVALSADDIDVVFTRGLSLNNTLGGLL